MLLLYVGQVALSGGIASTETLAAGSQFLGLNNPEITTIISIIFRSVEVLRRTTMARLAHFS